MNCYACTKPGVKLLICCRCNKAYHNECVMKPARFRAPRDGWICPDCWAKMPKSDNSNTPIKVQDSPDNAEQSASDDAEESSYNLNFEDFKMEIRRMLTEWKDHLDNKLLEQRKEFQEITKRLDKIDSALLIHEQRMDKQESCISEVEVLKERVAILEQTSLGNSLDIVGAELLGQLETMRPAAEIGAGAETGQFAEAAGSAGGREAAALPQPLPPGQLPAASASGGQLPPARRLVEQLACHLGMDAAAVAPSVVEAYHVRTKNPKSPNIITVKFNNCLHLQLYRDSKDRYKRGQTKASLSLQHYLGFESGFTLDKESNTIAVICQDIVVVLAFDTRERLIQWQVKISNNLGEGQQFLVLVSSAPPKAKVPSGPAKLHVQDHRFCMTAGVPPRLIGLWEIAHLRRYGVVEGRFCFEGGSHCGKGEGLHVFITDQGDDITKVFSLASQGKLALRKKPPTKKGPESPKLQKGYRPETRLSDLNTIDKSLPPDCGLYEDTFYCDDTGAVSPYWPSAEREFDDMGLGDAASVTEHEGSGPWAAGSVTLERCVSCISKLGAMSRSSTTALTPGTHFSPAWTMEAVHEVASSDVASAYSGEGSSNSGEYSIPKQMKLDICQCQDCPPERPPKPMTLSRSLKKPKMPLPLETDACKCKKDDFNPKVGPYENYDVPKVPHSEADSCDLRNASEYYDTPRRIKECLSNDLFKVTKSHTPGTLVLKKQCGCILKFGKKSNEPTIVDCDDNYAPAECPCQRVTNWAQNLIPIPYCKRSDKPESNDKDNQSQNAPNEVESDRNALYATVDVTRKTNRKTESVHSYEAQVLMNYENIEPAPEESDDGPLANYENLDFALSLEYYENAKDLLRRAGVTQNELDALSANLNPISFALKNGKQLCTKCGHPQLNPEGQNGNVVTRCKNDDYLMMEPPTIKPKLEHKNIRAPPGYTPMSPITNFTSQTLKNPALKNRVSRLIVEKSASNPALFGPPVDRSKKRSDSDVRIPGSAMLSALTSPNSPYARRQIMDSSDSIETIKRKRSSSADSSRFLEDVKEFDSSMGSRATSSSLETLRNMAIDNRRSSSPCIHQEVEYCEDAECCSKSGSENKASDADSSEASKDLPQLRKKLKENAHIKRSSSVPCKTGPNRDSSSSNDSGVSSCSLKHGGPEFTDFELPLTTANTRYHYMAVQKRLRGQHPGCLHASLPRRSKSSDPLRDLTFQLQRVKFPAKSSSAEAEVPVLPAKQIRGILDTHSTSSGTSDMSDYIETLSMSSSHSSSDTPTTLRINQRQATNMLRPRSGKEYHNIDHQIITSVYKSGKEMINYTNLP